MLDRPALATPALDHGQTDAGWADWSQTPFVADDSGWRIHLDASLDASVGRIEVFVDVQHQRTFLHPEAWATFQEYGPASQQFMDDFVWVDADRGGTRLIAPDQGVYGVAARLEAERAGTSSPFVKDRLVLLAEQARDLIVQAVQLPHQRLLEQPQEFRRAWLAVEQHHAADEQSLSACGDLLWLATAALATTRRPHRGASPRARG